MVNVKELQYKSIAEIIKILRIDGLVTVDLRNLAILLDMSVLPFGENQIKDEKIICAFVTNEKGRSCIFYKNELLEDKNFLVGRLVIAQAFARYIITGENNFFITQHTNFSNREKMLVDEMLMPELQVKEMIGKLILPSTVVLAKLFQVSEQFVRQRLAEINIKTRIAGYNSTQSEQIMAKLANEINIKSRKRFWRNCFENVISKI